MLKLGYIILAHQKPHQLLQLLRSLSSDSTYLFLHIDKRLDPSVFLSANGIADIKNLVLLPRFKSYWGSIGLAKASLHGIREALNYECDYITLLSGSDYPIKSNKQILQFLSESNGKSYVDYYRMPAPFWIPGKEINRIKKYYYHFKNRIFEHPPSPDGKGLFRKLLGGVLRLFLKNEREFPTGIIPFGGEHWFCLHKPAARQVLSFYEKNPEVMKFLTYSLSPEEIYVQTALFNSGDKELETSICNQAITLINWKNKNHPSPAFFDSSDFDRLISSDKLFARKFDFDACPDLLTRINHQLLDNQE